MVEKRTAVVSASIGYASDSSNYFKDQTAVRPYRDKNLFERILRELWFRFGLPEHFWYNKELIKAEPTDIYISDCLITPHYIRWVKEQCPTANISYCYHNLVGKAKHLMPDQIPDGIRVTTYDRGDSEKYNLILCEGGEFSARNIRPRRDPEYDIFYVGADKGRYDTLISLRDQFEKMGLRVKMIIVPDSRLSRRKKYYSRPISYDKVLEYDACSKAILNIVLEGQVAATKRDYEALFLQSKLITNNRHIRECDFYQKENIFILGEDRMEDLPEFINTPFRETDPNILKYHLCE